MRQLIKHQTKREELIKFLLLLAVMVGYFGYLSWKYDFSTGGVVSLLTWSFFVLCTPIADAGFLLDFPVRLITGIRMFVTEVIVWGLALIINLVCLSVSPQSYETTFITSLFYQILITPWPYWSVIVLCGVGTFMSIRFGDEMMDVISHKDREIHHTHGFKHRLIAMAALIILIVIAYYYLISSLGLDLSK